MQVVRNMYILSVQCLISKTYNFIGYSQKMTTSVTFLFNGLRDKITLEGGANKSLVSYSFWNFGFWRTIFPN
jgi:hypothetical protein